MVLNHARLTAPALPHKNTHGFLINFPFSSHKSSLKKLNKYWSNITGIPLHNFYKSKPDSRTKGKSTLKKDYKGVCAVHYLSTNLQFKLQSIGEIIIKSGAGGDRTLDPLPARQMLVPAELQPLKLIY